MSTSERPVWTDPISNRDALRESSDRLDAVLERVPDAADDLGWGLRLQEAVRGLRAAIAGHVDEAEAPEGTLAEIMSLKPDLGSKVSRQEREHAELVARASELEDEINEALAFSRLDTQLLSLAARVLCESLRLHLLRGADLHYEAHFRDEGGESG